MEYAPRTRPSPRKPDLRISDADRERLVDILGIHLGTGRLTVAEFDLRVARVYQAVTEDQARQEFGDLPDLPSPRSASVRRPRRRHIRTLPLHQRIEWSAWFAVGALNLAIWGIVSVSVGTVLYPWPVWVIGPWALVLLGRSLLGVEGRGCATRTVRPA